MTMEESNKLQELLNHNFFVDSRQIASAEYRSMPTRYVGPNGGSRIDILLIIQFYHNATACFQRSWTCYGPACYACTSTISNQLKTCSKNYLHFVPPLVMTNCPHVKLIKNFIFRLPRDWLIMLLKFLLMSSIVF